MQEDRAEPRWTECAPRRRSRRSWIWAGITAAALFVFGMLTRSKGPGAVLANAVLVGLGLLCWALAVLLWDLAAVWVEYVSRSRHLEYLRRRWRLDTEFDRGGRGGVPEAHADRRTGLWWRDYGPRT